MLARACRALPHDGRLRCLLGTAWSALAVWRAIVDGDDTVRYYYGTRVSSTWEPGAPIAYAYEDGSIAADRSIVETELGRRVALSFQPRWAPDIDADGPFPTPGRV